MGLLPPGTTKPYYRIDVDTPNGKAKLVFIAANAWDPTQSAWLTAQLTWERLGAAYGQFNDLGVAIDGLPQGLPQGVSDPGFRNVTFEP